MKTRISISVAGLLFMVGMVVPFAVAALETGNVTEDFGGTGRREERNTYAFWDTRNQEATLPLQYSFKTLPVDDASSGTSSSATSPVAKKFSEVATSFSRIPAGRIAGATPVLEDGKFLYVLSSGRLYGSIGGGMELTGGRIAELQKVEVRAIRSGPNKLLLDGRLQGKPAKFELALQGFAPSAALTTTKLSDAGGGNFFKQAMINVQTDLPPGTSVEYALSADGGAHFEEAAVGSEHIFSSGGKDLRVRAVLFTSDALTTPHLIKLYVAYTKAEVESPATLRRRDNTRTADLRNIADKLERFKKDRGVYPIVDGQTARVRLNQLAQLLIEGKYLNKLAADPKQEEYAERSYDYLATVGGSAYVLRAQLEEDASQALKKDLDDKPIEPNVFDYSCDDPWYCVGSKGLVVIAPTSPAPVSVGQAEIVQSEDGRVWRIASIGGGSGAVTARKLYIPSPTVIDKLRNFYARVVKIGQEQINQVPRARLIKLADKDDIYFITSTFLKRRIPSTEVFKSYNNDPQEIVVVKPEELGAYGDSRLIRLQGDTRVWYLEGGSRRLVISPAVMKKHKFDWRLVSPVNFAEYNSYPEGPQLE